MREANIVIGLTVLIVACMYGLVLVCLGLFGHTWGTVAAVATVLVVGWLLIAWDER